MNKYSRIFHHITVDEVKRSERDRNLLEKIEEFKEEEIREPVKHVDWRKDVAEEKLEENMQTTGFMNIIYPSMADENIQTLANGEEASYSTTTFGNGNTCAPYGDAGSTPSASSLNANGTGTGDGGNTGNFDVGSSYGFIPLGPYGADDNDGQLNLAPVDARNYDTIVVQAQVGDGTNGGRAPTDSYLDDPNEIGFGGLMVSYYLPQMDNTDANTDSWQLDATIEKYEPGYSRTVDPDYTDNLLPLWRDALPEGISQLREYSILIPPWAQKENVTFNIYGIGPLVESTGIGGDIAVKNVYFRRLKPVSVVASLDSPDATAFIHDGSMSSWKGSREKKRRELARQMKQSNIYLEKKFGPDFPGTGALPPGENQHGSRAWREAQRKDNPNFPRGMETRADYADSLKDHRGEPLFPEGYRTWYTRTGGRAAPGSFDSYRMQSIGRTPGVKYTSRKMSTSRAPRSRTAADIKRYHAAGLHIPDPRHREKYVKATQEKQRQAQYQRSLTKWKSDVGQWEKKTGMVYDYETGTAKSAKPSPSVDKAYKMSQKGGGFIQNLSSGERVQLGQSGIDAGEIEKAIDNGLPPGEMEVLKQKGVPDKVLRKAENAVAKARINAAKEALAKGESITGDADTDKGLSDLWNIGRQGVQGLIGAFSKSLQGIRGKGLGGTTQLGFHGTSKAAADAIMSPAPGGQGIAGFRPGSRQNIYGTKGTFWAPSGGTQSGDLVPQAAKEFSKRGGNVGRGSFERAFSGTSKTAGDIIPGVVPRGSGPGMSIPGTKWKEISSRGKVSNKAAEFGKRLMSGKYSKSAKAAQLLKTGATTASLKGGRAIAKRLGRLAPGVGITLAAADVAKRGNDARKNFANGNYAEASLDIAGALMGGLSGISGPIGWTALGAQIVFDVARSGNVKTNQKIRGRSGAKAAQNEQFILEQVFYEGKDIDETMKGYMTLLSKALRDSLNGVGGIEPEEEDFLKLLEDGQVGAPEDLEMVMKIVQKLAGEQEDVKESYIQLSEKKSSLKSPNQFFNPADIKPEYPDDPPPELTKRGYHPDLEAGEKVSNRYNKLDPISARSMPKTGNPHIDRKVAKAAKKPKDAREKKSSLRSPKQLRESDWTNTTTGNKVASTFTHSGSGDTFTHSAIGGVIPSTTEVGGETVSAPTESQYDVLGYAPLMQWDMQRKKSKKSREEINQQLDSSEDYAKEIKADALMKARLEKYYNDMRDVLLKGKKEVPQMPEDLKKWEKKQREEDILQQKLSVPDDDAMDYVAKVAQVPSAKNFVDYFIDNHINKKASQGKDLTNLMSKSTQNTLRSEMDRMRKTIDFYIKTGVSDAEIKAYVNKNVKRNWDLDNSMGNNLNFDVESYRKNPSKFKFKPTYLFTQEEDLELRGIPDRKTFFGYGPSITKPIIDAPKNYVKAKLGNRWQQAINNPMQYTIEIGSKSDDRSKTQPQTQPQPRRSSGGVPSGLWGADGSVGDDNKAALKGFPQNIHDFTPEDKKRAAAKEKARWLRIKKSDKPASYWRDQDMNPPPRPWHKSSIRNPSQPWYSFDNLFGVGGTTSSLSPPEGESLAPGLTKKVELVKKSPPPVDPMLSSPREPVKKTVTVRAKAMTGTKKGKKGEGPMAGWIVDARGIRRAPGFRKKKEEKEGQKK